MLEGDLLGMIHQICWTCVAIMLLVLVFTYNVDLVLL